jgi:diguanylate cyclase (GGDEF)-like protein
LTVNQTMQEEPATIEFEGLLTRFDAAITASPNEAFALAEAALGLGTSDHERAKALVRLAWAERLLSKLRDAKAHNDEALRIFEAVGDIENHTFALTVAGAIEVYSGQRERAYQQLMMALDQSRLIGHKTFEARACNALGVLFDWYSNPSAALEYLLEAQRLLGELGQAIMGNMVLSNIGAIHYRQGDYEKALEFYSAGLSGLQDLDAASNAVLMRLNIAETLIKLNRASEAETMLREALPTLQQNGDVLAETFTLRTLASSRFAQEKVTAALETYGEALRAAERAELTEDACLARLGIGQALIALGRAAEALPALEAARAGLTESSVEHQLEALKAVVVAHEALGSYKLALEAQRTLSNLEREYREEKSQRYVQSLMLRHELARTRRATADALERNRDLEGVLREKERLAAELERLSLQDPLTGLYNRRYLDLHFPELLEAFSAQGSSVSVAMLDLDHFKRVNDRFSHLIGDQVLRRTAGLLLEHARQGDIGVRFGGEEFLMIFPDTTLEAAHAHCERLRQRIAAFDWAEIHQQLSVRVSMGLVSAQPGERAEALLARADELLYKAKAAGRNRVMG